MMTIQITTPDDLAPIAAEVERLGTEQRELFATEATRHAALESTVANHRQATEDLAQALQTQHEALAQTVAAHYAEVADVTNDHRADINALDHGLRDLTGRHTETRGDVTHLRTDLTGTSQRLTDNVALLQADNVALGRRIDQLLTPTNVMRPALTYAAIQAALDWAGEVPERRIVELQKDAVAVLHPSAAVPMPTLKYGQTTTLRYGTIMFPDDFIPPSNAPYTILAPKGKFAVSSGFTLEDIDIDGNGANLRKNAAALAAHPMIGTSHLVKFDDTIGATLRRVRMRNSLRWVFCALNPERMLIEDCEAVGGQGPSQGDPWHFGSPRDLIIRRSKGRSANNKRGDDTWAFVAHGNLSRCKNVLLEDCICEGTHEKGFVLVTDGGVFENFLVTGFLTRDTGRAGLQAYVANGNVPPNNLPLYINVAFTRGTVSRAFYRTTDLEPGETREAIKLPAAIRQEDIAVLP